MVDPAAPPSSYRPGTPTVVCLASYFKGNEFLREAKAQGFHVVLLTAQQLLDRGWARDAIDEVFAVPSLSDRRVVLNVVGYLARGRDVTRIAALDDYDVELAAHLREHLRVPGMGETTARYFRDKLAMRTRAKAAGIPVPAFTDVINDRRIAEYLARVPPPWLLKPRSEASAVGIQKLHSADAVWSALEQLGDHRANYLLEKMIPGDICHVDAITHDRTIVFAEAHQYRRPLLEVAHDGGIFATRTLDKGGALERGLLETNARVIHGLGFVRGVTHTEFIHGRDDGQIYFLETAARVGGVHIADLVFATTGVHLWREYAKLELAQDETRYEPPTRTSRYGGLIVTLAKQKHPMTESYTDPEIVWRMADQEHHVGLAFCADDPARILSLLSEYERRFAEDFLAVLPASSVASH